MAGSIRRSIALVGVSLVVLAPAVTTAQEGPPGRESSSEDQELVVVIPPDWKETYPFSARFQDTEGAAHVIDLAAARFATDGLVDFGRARTFREPDLSTFPASNVREAFGAAALVGAERDLGIRDLFIVQARDAKAQVTLRQFLERARIPILDYIPDDAYLVRLDSRSHSLLGAQSDVFWIGLFQPAYRVAPDLDFILQADPGHQLRLRLRLDPETYASEDDVRAAIGAVPDATVVDVVRGRNDWIVRVDGPVTLARTFSALPGVTWVERFLEARLFNNVARTSGDVPTGRGAAAGPIMDVEDVWARGIRGEGQIAAAADTGLSTGDNTTPDSLHWDFGQVGSATNPMRVIKAYGPARAGIWDDPNPNGGHGTHTSGSIVGNGIRSGSDPFTNTFPPGSFAGTAPKAQFVFQSIMNAGGTLSVPADLNFLFQPPYDDGARVHSNSWGSPVNGAYDTTAQTLDQFAWDHKDMVITFAAGNEGTDQSGQDGVINTDSIASPGTAKNCITVGASENYRPTFVYEYPQGDCTGDALNQMTWGWFDYLTFPESPIYEDLMADNASGMVPFSSRGPADNQRFKPEVVAPGSGIISTRTNQSQAYEQWGICNVPVAQRPYYLSMGGTSMANPLTAGAATLVRQYYVDGWHANDSDVTNTPAVPAQGFNPSSALVKATLINGAWNMAPGQYGNVGLQPEIPPNWDRSAAPPRILPNNAEGYGRVDVEASLFPGSGWGRSPSRRMLARDVTPGLVTSGRDSRTYGVGSSSDPLIVTLVWTDPYAATAAATKCVNNLDLEVTSPSGKKYNPNKVDSSGASFTRDTYNTVEQVKVTAPETGAWTIDVVGTAVPGNAVPGTTTQPFAVVVSAVSCAVPATPVVTATPNGNYRVDVSWTSVPGAVEYYVYRGTVSGQATTQVATVAAPGTSFVDSPVAGGVTYYYVVKAASGPDCQSARSAEDSALTTGACTVPPAFGGLTSVTSAGVSPCGINLAWSAATASCGTQVSYSIYRATAPFTPSWSSRIASGLPATTVSYVDSSGLVAGTTYYYVVRATDETSGVEDTNTVQLSVQAGDVYLYGPETFDALVDGNMDGWTEGRYSGVATDWRNVMTCAAHSGGKIYRFGGTNCPTSYTSSAAGTFNEAWVRTPAIAVPAGSTNVRLSFWHRWAFEPYYDGAFLEISLDATNYYYVLPSAILSNTYNGETYLLGDLPVWNVSQPTFVNTVVNLDAACNGVPGNTGGCSGKTVNIGFVALNDEVFNDLGWFIDDVQVTRDPVGSCSLAPAPVRFLSARATPGTNLLEWQNPISGGYGSAIVRFKTALPYPASVTDGTALTCVGQNTALGAYNSCSQTGLTGTSTYYYSVFVDNGSGVYSSSRTVSATQFAVGTGVRKWAYSTGAANLAPAGVLPGAVGAGAIFAVSNDRALHAVDPAAAGGNWPRTSPFTWIPTSMNGPAQHRPPVVPLAEGPRVFLASQDGFAYAVNARSGALRWRSDKLGDVLQANPAGLFSDLRPTAPNRLFVGTRNATSANTLYALDPADGHTLGQFDNGGGANAIGVITGITVDYDTNYVYFTSRAPLAGSSDTLWCVDGTTMTKVWSLPLGDIDGSPVLYPANLPGGYPGGRLYVGTNAGEVKAINASTHAVVWTYTCNPLNGPVKGFVSPHFGVSPLRLYFATTARVWGIVDNGATVTQSFSSTAVPNPSTPLYVNGTTYLLVGNSNGTLYQLLTTNGSTRGTVSLGTVALGSPARDSVNGLFHVGSTAGVLHAFTLPVP
jgi:outer membrane protein assembly factor BamB